MRSLCVGLALACLALPAAADQTISRSGPVDQVVRVYTYVRYRGDCRPSPPPNIQVRTQPAHGTLEIKPGTVTVDGVRPGKADCSGKSYTGVGVWYTPAAGYRGTDQFDWNVISSDTPSHDSAVIEIK